jgi:DNA-binding MarR family transcriptional regulator
MDIPPELQKIRQILNWVGVAQQLMVTRLNRTIADTDLPFAQFVMLNHFRAFADEGHTIGRLANAFETGQPGISKTVARLVDKGYLRTEPDPEDGRSRLIYLTEAGAAAHQEALMRIAPDAALIFADWPASDIDELHRLIFKLKSWLDENRDTRA